MNFRHVHLAHYHDILPYLAPARGLPGAPEDYVFSNHARKVVTLHEFSFIYDEGTSCVQESVYKNWGVKKPVEWVNVHVQSLNSLLYDHNLGSFDGFYFDPDGDLFSDVPISVYPAICSYKGSSLSTRKRLLDKLELGLAGRLTGEGVIEHAAVHRAEQDSLVWYCEFEDETQDFEIADDHESILLCHNLGLKKLQYERLLEFRDSISAEALEEVIKHALLMNTPL